MGVQKLRGDKVIIGTLHCEGSSNDAEEFHLEVEGGVWRDETASCAAFAVAEVGGNDDAPSRFFSRKKDDTPRGADGHA